MPDKKLKISQDVILQVLELLGEFNCRVRPIEMCRELFQWEDEGGYPRWAKQFKEQGAIAFFRELDLGNRRRFAKLVAEEFQCSPRFMRNRDGVSSRDGRLVIGDQGPLGTNIDRE